MGRVGKMSLCVQVGDMSSRSGYTRGRGRARAEAEDGVGGDIARLCVGETF